MKSNMNLILTVYKAYGDGKVLSTCEVTEM